MNLAPTPARECWHGARDSLPMLIGAAPFGLIFGSLAGPAGLSPLATLAMSLLVFAGSSQFIAVSMLSAGSGLLVIVATTLAVNLRHALYSADLQRHVARLSHPWRLALAFWLTDETYAVVQHRYGQADASPYKHWYYLGSCLAMYGNWFAWTLAGILLGQSWPGLRALGLEFAMVATFTGIVIPMLRNRPMLAAALVAAGVALASRHWPYKLGLMAAALAGVMVGLMLEGKSDEQA